MLKIEEFHRRPLAVQVVQITPKNMREAAAWCRGEIKETHPNANGNTRKFIQVPVSRPVSNRQTQAFVGDFVCKAETGFKVYLQNAFPQSFEKRKPVRIPNPRASRENLEQAIENTGAVKLITDIFTGGDDDTRVVKPSPPVRGQMNGIAPTAVIFDELAAEKLV